MPSHEAYVVGAPGENIGAGKGRADAGAVTVVDLSSREALSLVQGEGAIPDSSEAGDNFGLRVAAAGNLLVASAPNEDLSGRDNVGAVFQAVLGCDGSTPTVTSAAKLSLDSPQVPGYTQQGDRFGLELAFSTLAAGEVDGAQLLVGAPLKADASKIDAGRVTVFSTRTAGLFVGAGSTGLGQSTSKIGDKPEYGDTFGAAIAANS